MEKCNGLAPKFTARDPERTALARHQGEQIGVRAVPRDLTRDRQYGQISFRCHRGLFGILAMLQRPGPQRLGKGWSRKGNNSDGKDLPAETQLPAQLTRHRIEQAPL
jgi:hypothetical protein